jgi:hypothetical protein
MYTFETEGWCHIFWILAFACIRAKTGSLKKCVVQHLSHGVGQKKLASKLARTFVSIVLIGLSLGRVKVHIW